MRCKGVLFLDIYEEIDINEQKINRDEYLKQIAYEYSILTEYLREEETPEDVKK